MTAETRARRLEYTRKWRQRNAERILLYNRKWATANREHLRAYVRRRRKESNEEICAADRRYRSANLERVRVKEWRSKRRRLKNNPSFRLAHYLGNRMRKTMHGAKGAKMIAILGCSITDFWIYLESKFEPGMTRENYGKVWHVDHIMPCAIFDLTKLEHQKRCFHFSNLQPLFAKENRAKHTKIVNPQFNLM